MNRQVLEEALRLLAAEFQGNSLNLLREDDLRSKLYALLEALPEARKQVTRGEAKLSMLSVHTNWFGLKARGSFAPRGYCDVAVLTDKSLRALCTGAAAQAHTLPCLAGIETRRWERLQRGLRPGDQADIDDLKMLLLSRRIKHGYALVFINQDACPENKERFQQVAAWYQHEVERTAGLQVWLVPRQGRIYRLRHTRPQVRQPAL